MNIMKVVIASMLCIMSAGCGSLFGVEEFEVFKGGPKWKFSAGTDFHVGANSIDRVDDRRGISKHASTIDSNGQAY